MRAATSTRVTFREEAPYSRKRPCSLDDDATWIVLEETMCVVSRSCPNSRRFFHPSWTSAALLPGVGSLYRERVFFLSLSSWHLPKVLILQSASARAGADRTFSDQYLGQVPEGQQVKKRDRSQGLLRVVFLSCWLRVRPRGWYTVHGNVDHVSAVCNWSVSGMKKRIQRPL